MTAHSRIPFYCENIHNCIIADVLGRTAKIIGVFKYTVCGMRQLPLLSIAFHCLFDVLYRPVVVA